MIFVGVMLLVFFVAVLFIKPKCPDCGSKMDDIDIYHGKTVFRCRNCGKEWI